MTVYTRLSSSALSTALLFSALTASAASPVSQPIHTHFAETQSQISLEISATRFTDVELDEADNFDGESAALDLVIPYTDNKQFRLSVPFYTEGDAQLKSSDMPIDIDGKGGVFNYATLQFEHQIHFSEQSGFNLAYRLGAGIRTDRLDTTIGDYYNHTGKMLLLGAKMDKAVRNDRARLLVNAGIRYYIETDDLHPDNKNSWTWADIKTAMVFSPWGEYVQPVFEITYLGDFGNYNAIAMVPQLIFPLGKSLSLKLGGILGLTDDGNQSGAVGSLSYSF